MKVAKQAVQYYVAVTGKNYDDFFASIEMAISQENPTDMETWLLKELWKVIEKEGITLQEFKANKDTIRGTLDADKRKNEGEFYTPEIWCAEGRKYFDKYIPDWHEYNVWDGSCYSMDTEVFTKRGWVLYDDLLDNDLIYSLNPRTHKAEWTGFHSRFKKKYTGNMVHIDSRAVDSLVTEDHLMYCGRRVNKEYKEPSNWDFVSALDLYKSCEGKSPKYTTYYLKTTAETNEEYLYSDDTLENSSFSCNMSTLWILLGLYIGDGSSQRNSSGKVNAINFSVKKDRKIQLIKDCLDTLGLVYITYDYRGKNKNDNFTFRVTNKEFIDIIETYIGFDFKVKRLPFSVLKQCYMKDLLYGLYFSDGTVYATVTEYKEDMGMSKDSIRFWSANKELRNDVATLCQLLGYCVKSAERTRTSYRSNLTVHEYSLDASGRDIFGVTSQSISLVPYDDFVWDLTTNNDNHIFLVRRNGKTLMSKNCGTANLMRTSGHNQDKLFLSTLRQEDLATVAQTFPNATLFPLDFLSKIDYDEANREFFDQFPDKLKNVILNDEPLIIYMNPPYKTGSVTDTDVGRYMSAQGLSKPAYDIYYQFVWRVMNIVEKFNLKNTWVSFFGPLTWFTGSQAGVLLAEYEHVFEFIDGMCLSAQEFSDTSESVSWGIGCTLWKSRGGYQPDQLHKDILLERKFKTPEGTIAGSNRVLFAPPRERLCEWVKPKDVIRNISAPVMTSQLTFKGTDKKEGVFGGKIASNAICTLMTENTLNRAGDQCGLLSMPTSIQYCSVTEENFWRCVGSFGFRRIYVIDWSQARKEINAPNTSVEGYHKWLMNCLALFLFDWKSLTSSLRDVPFAGEKMAIRNKLFPCTGEEVRANCNDERILEDLDNYPPVNDFILEKIEEAKPFWCQEAIDLYEFGKKYILFTYNERAKYDYKDSIDCWDCNFHQLRGVIWDSELDAQLISKINKLRDYLRKPLGEFGFVTEVIE